MNFFSTLTPDTAKSQREIIQKLQGVEANQIKQIFCVEAHAADLSERLQRQTEELQEVCGREKECVKIGGIPHPDLFHFSSTGKKNPPTKPDFT
mmetsp:Transcript_40772/g.56686  ORF Transcript_40772/g.56686 Transcript_40772/m.56686 type:complete len:94 (-) Transcript_40772:2515-2796(-)